MKKLLILIFFIPLVASAAWYNIFNPLSWFDGLTFGAPQYNLFRSLIPETDSKYYVGTSTIQWAGGHFDEICLSADCKTSWPSSGTGVGTISTSTIPTIGNLSYWTGIGYPSTLGTVATTTLTATTPLALSQAISVIGGSASVLSISTTTNNLFSGVGGQILSYNDGVGYLPIATSSINVGTATALANNGANCNAGNAPLGVDASGAVESCFDVWTEAENTSAAYIALTDLSATWPIVYNSGTGAFTFTGLSTTTDSGVSDGLAYFGSGILTSTATSSIKGSEITNDSNWIALTDLSATSPIIYDNSTGAFTWVGLATTTQPSSSNLLVSNGGAGVFGVATNTVSCSGSVSCSSFDAITSGSITITGTDNTASTTLLGDTNYWSTLQTFTYASTTYASFDTASTSALVASNSVNLFGGGAKTTANALCQQLTGSADLCDGSDATGSGGAGTVSTSSAPTIGNLAFWTSTGAWPETLGTVATTSLTAASPLALSNAISVIGGSASEITLDTSGLWTGIAGQAYSLVATSSLNLSDFNNDSAFIALTDLSATWPITYNSGTGAIAFDGLSTTTDSGVSDGLAYFGSGILTSTATSSLNTSELTNDAAFIDLTDLSATYPISYDNGTGAFTFGWSYPFPSGATTTLLTFTYASTTYASFDTASSTQWIGGGLQECNATTGKLNWDSTTLQFKCDTDQTGAGGAFSWTVLTDANATTSPLLVGTSTLPNAFGITSFGITATSTDTTDLLQLIDSTDTEVFAVDVGGRASTTNLSASGWIEAGGQGYHNNLAIISAYSTTTGADYADLFFASSSDLFLGNFLRFTDSNGTDYFSMERTGEFNALRVDVSSYYEFNNKNFLTAFVGPGALHGAGELDNTFLGDGAGTTNPGNGNTLVGYSTANGSLGNTSDYNTIIGSFAADLLGLGGNADDNVIIGAEAAQAVTTGSQNIIIGAFAGYSGTALTTGSNNIIIGDNGDAGSATRANAILIGNGLTANNNAELRIGSLITGQNSDSATLGALGIGTSTPKWKLQAASTTMPQLALTGNATDDHWTFRSIGNTFAIATASPTTYATTTVPSIKIGSDNVVTFGNNSATCIALTGSADLCDGSDASGGGGDWSWDLGDYLGVTVNSTTTPLRLLATTPYSLIASSSLIQYASTTQLSVGSDYVTDLDGAGLTLTSGVLNLDWTYPFPSAATTTIVDFTNSLKISGGTQGFAYLGSGGLVNSISTSTLANYMFPFTAYGASTSTILGFTNGFFSTASSTISSALRLPSLTQGFSYIGSGGLVSTISTSTLANHILPFTSYGFSTSSVAGFTGGLFSTASSTFSSTFNLPAIAGNFPYVNSSGTVVATTSPLFVEKSFTNWASTTPGLSSSIYASGATTTISFYLPRTITFSGAGGNIRTGTSLLCEIGNGTASTTRILTTTAGETSDSTTLSGKVTVACGSGISNPDDANITFYGEYAK